MFKKILLWSMFILFAGILVFGAVYRTSAKTEQQSDAGVALAQGAQGSGYRGGAGARPVDDTHEPPAEQPFYGRQSDSVDPGRGQGFGGQSSGGQSSGGQSSGAQGSDNRGAAADAPGAQDRQRAQDVDVVHESVTYTGEVVQVPGAGIDLILATAEGEMTIGTGPNYLAGEGFVLAVSESVEITGFWEDGEFKAVTIVRLADGSTITLRDATGRPNWSGAVRSGRGQGGGGRWAAEQ